MGLVQLLPVRLGVRNLCIPVKAITYDKEVMTWCESGVVWLRGQTMNIRHERQTNLLAPPPAFGRLGAAKERERDRHPHRERDRDRDRDRTRDFDKSSKRNGAYGGGGGGQGGGGGRRPRRGSNANSYTSGGDRTLKERMGL